MSAHTRLSNSMFQNTQQDEEVRLALLENRVDYFYFDRVGDDELPSRARGTAFSSHEFGKIVVKYKSASADAVGEFADDDEDTDTVTVDKRTFYLFPDHLVPCTKAPQKLKLAPVRFVVGGSVVRDDVGSLFTFLNFENEHSPLIEALVCATLSNVNGKEVEGTRRLKLPADLFKHDAAEMPPAYRQVRADIHEYLKVKHATAFTEAQRNRVSTRLAVPMLAQRIAGSCKRNTDAFVKWTDYEGFTTPDPWYA